MPRPQKKPTTAEMLRAARLFYKENWSRKQISAPLNTDIRGVTRILKEAQKQGVVKIQIFESAQSDLDQRIRAAYPHIQKTIIAIGGQINTPDKHMELHQRWAIMAADYFEELFENHPHDKPFHVGVAGGEHILEFVNAIPSRDRSNLHVHVTALIGRGRLSESTSHNDPVVNASVLWSHSGRLPGRSEYATVSPYVTKGPGPAARLAVKEEIKKVEANKTVVEIIKAMNSIDVAFVGIGAVNVGRISPITRDRVTITGLLENIVTPQQLAREGAVGDLSYCLFDANGKSHKKWQFFLTAGHGSNREGVDFYKHMVATGKKVVAFGGPYQMDPIKVALKAKMFNVWVTDEYTARRIAEGN
jgi:DNA-binding transcriptional regulator LsrR (DeoR family)